VANSGTNRPRSALGDGAERLARLARTVREQQIAEMPGAMRLAVSDVYSLSPDEVWSKKFMSQGIGPTPDCAAPGGFCPMPFEQVQIPQPTQSPPIRPEPLASASPAGQIPLPRGGQIGQAIGKPLKRRSWLGRALRGSP
jgi:hypothetical protein